MSNDTDTKISHLLVAAPLAHIVACAIFISGYCAGFQGNIITLIKVTDIFAIPFHYILTMYVTGIGIPVLFIAYRHRAGYDYAVNVNSKIENDNKRLEAERNRRTFVKVSTIVCSVLCVISILILYIQVKHDLSRSYYLSSNFILVCLLPFWWHAMNSINVHGLKVEITWVILIFCIGVFTLGADAGESDRWLPYEKVASERFKCKKKVVLRSIADNYIVVEQSSIRQIVDKDCKVIFTFNPVKPIINKSVWELYFN